MQGYVCEGNSGKTFGLDTGDEVHLLIEYPNDERGSVSQMSEMENWSLERWKGQMGAEEVEVSELPEKLRKL